MLLGDHARAWATTADGDATERVSDDMLDAVESQVVPADEMVVIFTSGSTDEPKAVVHTQGAVFRKTSMLNPGVSPPGGCVFLGQPFFWVGGLQNLGTALQTGATLVCQPKPDPAAALALIERTRATMVIAWANTTLRLRADPSFATRDLSAIPQLTMSGGDIGLRHNSLGMTETMGPHTGFARPGAPPEEQATPLPERLRGSFGAPLPFIEHKIVDPVSGDDLADGEEGEICVRGYSLMTRMYKRERQDVFDRDGWFHTTDRGYFRDGYLFFTGRLTEMIKTHGANVSPREVEVVLEAQPDVDQAFVMGVPDADRGEQVVAAVVPAGPAALDVDDLRRRLAAELSSYKVPRRFVILSDEEVPWLASGKADRLSIREMLLKVWPLTSACALRPCRLPLRRLLRGGLAPTPRFQTRAEGFHEIEDLARLFRFGRLDGLPLRLGADEGAYLFFVVVVYRFGSQSRARESTIWPASCFSRVLIVGRRSGIPGISDWGTTSLAKSIVDMAKPFPYGRMDARYCFSRITTLPIPTRCRSSMTTARSAYAWVAAASRGARW